MPFDSKGVCTSVLLLLYEETDKIWLQSVPLSSKDMALAFYIPNHTNVQV